MILDTHSSLPQTDQLQVVRRCFRYASLDRRGHLSRAEQNQLDSLRRLLEGDPTWQRRTHRRLPLLLPVSVDTRGGRFRGTLLNVSGGGMFVVSTLLGSPGDKVRIVIPGPKGTTYVFACEVRRVIRHGQTIGLGLRFIARPETARLPLAA